MLTAFLGWLSKSFSPFIILLAFVLSVIAAIFVYPLVGPMENKDIILMVLFICLVLIALFTLVDKFYSLIKDRKVEEK